MSMLYLKNATNIWRQYIVKLYKKNTQPAKVAVQFVHVFPQ